MSGVFISYRRDDSAGFAGRLFDFLSAAFPGNTVFIDIDGIDAGRDFVEALHERLASCEVLLAIIGRQWLETAADGSRRIDRPDDYVRLEIETALQRNIRVIPVLVGGAQMPAKAALPDSLEPLTRRNALEISHARFSADAQRLAEILAPLLPSARKAQSAGMKRLLIAGGAVLAALPLVAFVAIWAMKPRPPVVDAPPAPRHAEAQPEARPTPVEAPRVEAPAPPRTDATPRPEVAPEPPASPPRRPPLQVLKRFDLDTGKARIEIAAGPNRSVKRRAWCERLTVYTEFGNFSLIDWHREDRPSGAGESCAVRTKWKDHRTEAILTSETSPWPGALNASLEALCPKTFMRKLEGCTAY